MSESSVNPYLCPLCQQKNRCANVDETNKTKACWCFDHDITFTKSLLDSIPEDKKNNACVCQKCAQNFNV